MCPEIRNPVRFFFSPPQCFQDVLRSYLQKRDTVEKRKNPLESFQPGHFLERDDAAAEIKFGRGLSCLFSSSTTPGASPESICMV